MTERLGARDTPCYAKPWRDPTAAAQAGRPDCTPPPGGATRTCCLLSLRLRRGPPGRSSERRATMPGHWAGVKDVTTTGSPSQFPTPNVCHVATFPLPSAPARPASDPGSYSLRSQSHSGLLKRKCAPRNPWSHDRPVLCVHFVSPPGRSAPGEPGVLFKGGYVCRSEGSQMLHHKQ